jgi:hypothetical protein
VIASSIGALVAVLLYLYTSALPTPPPDPVGPPGMPPPGHVLLGTGGSDVTPRDFDQLTGAEHKIHLVTTNWNERRPGGWEWALVDRFDEGLRGNYRLMVHIGPSTPTGAEGRSPGAVARGDGDFYLLDLGRIVNWSNQYIYIRPPGEMNGSWSPWSAFNADGTPRDADHAAIQYRRAFIRIAEIVRGGSVAAIDARLRAQSMPPLQTEDRELPSSGRVSLVWNPQAQGSPNVPGNQPADYYPGAQWVDYVADDLYAQKGHAAWAQNDALYARYSSTHPFMMAEWAPWAIDDPTFGTRMFEWVRRHPRTVALIYFNGTGNDTFHLSKKPTSIAAYRVNARALVLCASMTAYSHECD